MGDDRSAPTPPSNPPNCTIGPSAEFDSLGVMRREELHGRLFTAWAAPLSWGPWVQVAAHGGAATFDIAYEVIGDTLVLGTVNYYSPSGWRTEVFRDSVSIQTGDAWAAVNVCFQGNPLGSTIRGQVDP
jgi:hypothetical protein